MSSDLQMLLEPVAHFIVGLKSWDIAHVKGEKLPVLFSGYMETNSARNRIAVGFAVQNFTKTQSMKMISSGITC
jgi:hypothetical protein